MAMLEQKEPIVQCRFCRWTRAKHVGRQRKHLDKCEQYRLHYLQQQVSAGGALPSPANPQSASQTPVQQQQQPPQHASPQLHQHSTPQPATNGPSNPPPQQQPQIQVDPSITLANALANAGWTPASTLLKRHIADVRSYLSSLESQLAALESGDSALLSTVSHNPAHPVPHTANTRPPLSPAEIQKQAEIVERAAQAAEEHRRLQGNEMSEAEMVERAARAAEREREERGDVGEVGVGRESSSPEGEDSGMVGEGNIGDGGQGMAPQVPGMLLGLAQGGMERYAEVEGLAQAMGGQQGEGAMGMQVPIAPELQKLGAAMQQEEERAKKRQKTADF